MQAFETPVRRLSGRYEGKEQDQARQEILQAATEGAAEGKVEHEGFMLWRRCMDGDELAWARMRRYNIRDVLLLEEAYLVLRPWIRSHPSHAAFTGRNVCPKCGSARIEGRGLATLTTGRYQRLHCLECGAWSRSTQRIEKTAVVQIAS